MKCTQCETEFEGKFCPNCGAASNGQAPANSGNPAPKAVKSKKPIYKKWWFWLIIVVLVIGVVGGTANGGDEPKKGETSAPSSTNSSANSSTSSKDETFGLNTAAIFKDIKVTANSIEESEGDGFFVPSKGKIFVGVKFTIENISDSDQSISSLLLFDAYVDGVKLGYSVNASCAFSDGTLDGTLTPGKKLVGYYAVEVPEDWKELELQVKSSWLSNKRATFVFNSK